MSNCVPAGPMPQSAVMPPDGAYVLDSHLDSLYRAHDYFALRTQLPSKLSSTDTTRVRTGFYLAAVQHAFNEPLRSNSTISHVLQAKSVPDSLRFELRRMQLSNDLRLNQYANADSVASAILATPPHSADSATLANIRNTGRLMRALRDVPPQVATKTALSVLRTDGARRIPVEIGDSLRHYGFDTGANLSVLMRSEAEALGLEIQPVGLAIGSSTDASVAADIAVAPHVTIGRIDYQNVVFLVLPDSALTFPGGFRIPGLIGFPVIEAMGEIRFMPDGSLEIPAQVPIRSLHNLALEELRPLVQVDYDGEKLVCLLDTGAGQTSFFAPYYLRHRARFESQGAPDSMKTGGAGGVRKLPVYRLPRVDLALGDTTVVLHDVPVHTSFLHSPKDEPACRIGRDVLNSFGKYVLNFRSMTLALH